nr:hypothetical protein [uncultured Pseudokineococcus sp.]
MSDDADQPDRPGERHDDAAPVEDELVTTHHVLTTPDGELRYTARAGRVVLSGDRVEDGVWKGRRPRAQVGITAYTLDGADPLTRPVTFAFNGGPGSSSVWLHLGLLGPRRVVAGDAGAPEPPPGRLVDNPESLLAVSDLVFVDPVSTGRSRVVEGERAGDFHGFTADVESVGEVVRQWVTAEGRWLSPKLLAGESYGTTRAAALAEHLQGAGMYLSGLVLVSAVLNFGVLVATPGDDRSYPRYLPFYAATAHRHGRHPGRELADAGPADRPLGGVRRPRRPARRAPALLRRAAARRGPRRRTPRLALHRARRLRHGGGPRGRPRDGRPPRRLRGREPAPPAR